MLEDFGRSRIAPLSPLAADPPARLNLVAAARLLGEIETALDRDPGAARSALRQLALCLQRLGQSAAAGEGPGHPAGRRGGLTGRQFRAVVAHIDDHLAENVRVGDLAALARLSYGYFHKAFKATTGDTPHGFIVRRRLEHAKSLMLNTQDPLSQIAYACGLSDQAHLSRLFRQHVGDTPQSWRRIWREAA